MNPADKIDRRHSGTATAEGWSGEGDGNGERRRQRKQQLDRNDDSVLMEERAGDRVAAGVETAVHCQRLVSYT
ncbi:hypothetical protein J1N35_023483 [Gossypium stocksii]|uniref:Uncharacterized protein n=1 Tax=Gossypium stocksii TaxID=47602 RepID=A0A9D4A3Q6_9ROSI|nr:hypothetical protein J1N35_023483 [Gossypium stocksii]